MSELNQAQPATATTPTPFKFLKSHSDLFKLYLKTLFFSVFTLGIYSFWGRVAITKYLYNHTSFGNRSFDYHATGKEMFIGFLKGIAIFAVAAGVFFGIIALVPLARIPLSIAAYVGGLFFLVPFIVIGKWRFWLSRSSYCNVRFKNAGAYVAFRGIWIRGLLLSIVTLGFYLPVLQNKTQKYFTNHTRFGTLEFAYTGKDGEYFRMAVIGALLSIVTFGMYSFWYAAKLNRYILSHTTVNGRSFNSTMTGGGLFALSVTNLLLVIGTLSLGFPVAANRMYHYFFSNMTLDANPEDLATVAATMDTGASAFASGLEEAANVADAVAGIF